VLGTSTCAFIRSNGGEDGEAHTESQKDFLQHIWAISQKDALGY